MNEFPFPPGPIPDPWAMVVHLALLCLLAAALSVLVWRSSKPARARDVVGWLAVGLASGILSLASLRENARWPFATSYAIWLGMVSFVAIGMTLTRLQRPETTPFRAFTSSLSISLVLVLGLALVTPPNRYGPGASKRSQCKNNLKQIGLALRTYFDTHDRFSPPTFRTDDGPARSWRVELLPHMHNPSLRSEYDDASPWDGPQNRRLAQRAPSFLQCPAAPRTEVTLDGTAWQTTAYVMIRGPHAAGTDSGRPSSEFADGFANTATVAEAPGQMIPWLQPEDVEPTPTTSGINLPGSARGKSRGVASSYHPGGANILMADGSVRFVSQQIDPKTLQAILTVDGGEEPGEF